MADGVETRAKLANTGATSARARAHADDFLLGMRIVGRARNSDDIIHVIPNAEDNNAEEDNADDIEWSFVDADGVRCTPSRALGMCATCVMH
jgi:hypothetical protein